MKDAGLEAAFRATTYRVDTGTEVFDLRIGQPNLAFEVFLSGRRVSSWAVVTACNPGAVRSDADNVLRQAQLRDQLRARGWSYCLACNVADAGNWPDEPGYLVLQISEPAARILAAAFDQRACVCGVTGSVPRLVWIRPHPDLPQSVPDQASCR